LKAARPFVPLSEDEPGERLALMLAVAEPAALITSRPAGEVPEALRELPRIDVPIEPAPGRSRRRRRYDPHAAAYGLVTSGSTGRPKGVSVRHGALLNRILWGQRTFALTADDTVLQKTPYTFDVALPELLGPLIAGARVYSLDPGAHRDPGEIADTITRERITMCHFVPSMLREFLRWPTARECRSLRHVGCGGEALTP